MVRQALLKYDRYLPKTLPRLPPILGPPKQYGPPMMTLIPLSPFPSVLPNDTDESDDDVTYSPQPLVLNDKNIQEAFPWRPLREAYPNAMSIKKIGRRRPRLPWKQAPNPVFQMDQPDRLETVQQAKINYLTPSSKLYAAQDTRPTGLALEVNGDMKAIIPPTIGEAWRRPIDDLTESPADSSPQLLQSPLQAYFLKYRDSSNTADNNSEDDTEKDGPLSDKMFRKKREIIRELKSLFQVLFEGEMSGRNIVKSSTKRHRVKIARGGKKAKITANNNNSNSKRNRNQKKSIVTHLEDSIGDGESSKKSYRPSKRVILYKRLIGDLNDLISLEINKSNGKKAIQGKLQGGE